jgi:hypothetical protein
LALYSGLALIPERIKLMLSIFSVPRINHRTILEIPKNSALNKEHLQCLAPSQVTKKKKIKSQESRKY